MDTTCLSISCENAEMRASVFNRAELQSASSSFRLPSALAINTALKDVLAIENSRKRRLFLYSSDTIARCTDDGSRRPVRSNTHADLPRHSLFGP